MDVEEIYLFPKCNEILHKQKEIKIQREKKRKKDVTFYVQRNHTVGNGTD